MPTAYHHSPSRLHGVELRRCGDGPRGQRARARGREGSIDPQSGQRRAWREPPQILGLSRPTLRLESYGCKARGTSVLLNGRHNAKKGAAIIQPQLTYVPGRQCPSSKNPQNYNLCHCTFGVVSCIVSLSGSRTHSFVPAQELTFRGERRKLERRGRESTCRSLSSSTALRTENWPVSEREMPVLRCRGS